MKVHGEGAGGGGLTAAQPAAKRRWKGHPVAVFALIVFSLFVSLVFLLGLHKRFPSGYLADVRFQQERSFANYYRSDGYHDHNPSEVDQPGIHNLTNKTFTKCRGDATKDDLVYRPCPKVSTAFSTLCDLFKEYSSSSVTVNSTAVNHEESDEMVFHVITDEQNFFSMKHWFARNSYRKATIHILNFDELKLSHLLDSDLAELPTSEEFRVSTYAIAQPSPLQNFAGLSYVSVEIIFGQQQIPKGFSVRYYMRIKHQ
ncbi:hypothetical protein OPV22_001465 [Ensete ventricosum]|uniref:Hexosyltransferase n=1 Tax=Ensete ventricosum TaxID=4639 RepID=A0AAV8RSB9_ENSVE|nr:hypothetical protein OPV22_001465 [Ensete ventricosum]